MRIVLHGWVWRCSERRNVAVLTGELFGPDPAHRNGRAKSLGTCAFSGSWPVSDVDQLGVKTVVRARSLRRRAERRHLGDLPLYYVDERELTPVHVGEDDSGAEKGGGASSGVARPCECHAATLPRAFPPGPRGGGDGGGPGGGALPKTPEERADAGKAVARAAFFELWSAMVRAARRAAPISRRAPPTSRPHLPPPAPPTSTPPPP